MCIYCTIPDACHVLVMKQLQLSAYLGFSRVRLIGGSQGSKIFETLVNNMITRSLQHNSTTTCLFYS